MVPEHYIKTHILMWIRCCHRWSHGSRCSQSRVSYLSAHTIHTQSHLRVVHVPQQVALLSVQDEVSPQELAAALNLLDVQKTADAILSVHVRHRNPDQLSPPWGITGTLPGGGTDRHLMLPQVKAAVRLYACNKVSLMHCCQKIF